jgi:hypothetical protein
MNVKPGYILEPALALDQIAALMSGQEWDSDTTAAISDIVRATGRVIADSSQYDDDETPEGYEHYTSADLEADISGHAPPQRED